jgi:hypothetical protein
MTKHEKAANLNELALELQGKGQLKEAVALYREAAAHDPGWAVPLYNLGLLYKRKRRWKLSLKYNRLATTVDASNEAAWWNLGIAATALGRWQLARAAWRGYGINLPDGNGPVDFPCGYGPVRLDPECNAEVVWAYRLDPARAMLVSIPFPESGHRWSDVVLNDGAPSGYRQHNGQEIPVLNALDLLAPSPFGTYVARVQMPDNSQFTDKLTEQAAEMGGCAEDWSTSVRIICKACSEGRPHEVHDTKAAPADGVHLIAIAARDRKHASNLLHVWESGLDEVRVESLDEALAPGSAD